MIKITCNDCGFEFETSITNHLDKNNKTGCRGCTNNIPMDINRFIRRGREIYGFKFNYDKVDTTKFPDQDSRVIIKCIPCDYEFDTRIREHLAPKKHGCKSCAKQLIWTFENFEKRFNKIWNGKFDYSEVVKEDIIDSSSVILITCNDCHYKFPTTITRHNKKSAYGCAGCAGNLVYNYERFIIRATELYGNRFNYQKINPSDVHGSDSIITVICNKCDYEFETIIKSHFDYSRIYGCRKCGKNLSYTLETFLEKAISIHDNRYDYSKVKAEQIINYKSKVPIMCKICYYEFEITIYSHIYHQNDSCKRCSGQEQWNCNSVIKKSKELYGNRFELFFEDIEQKITRRSLIKVLCNVCNKMDEVTVTNHIYFGGCKTCNNVVPWSINKLISKSRLIHNDQFDYSNTNPLEIRNVKSLINIKCLHCSYKWMSSIKTHIGHQTGCPKCKGNAQWNFDLFTVMVEENQNFMINYDEVKPRHIINNRSKIPLKCNICFNEWIVNISYHFHKKSGCPFCKMSNGEKECILQLSNLSLTYKPQAMIKSLHLKRYDFKFEHEGETYLLEFDGEQHFKFVDRFHKDHEEFINRQNIDVIKTQYAMNEGYRIIRIDFKEINNVRFHIENALEINHSAYFSNKDLYQYILSKIY